MPTLPPPQMTPLYTVTSIISLAAANLFDTNVEKF